MSSAASGWCCRRFPVCSGAALQPPDAYESCESHKASVCGKVDKQPLRLNTGADALTALAIKNKSDFKYVPSSRDVHVCLQHQVRRANVILTTVFKERDLGRCKWRTRHVFMQKVGGTEKAGSANVCATYRFIDSGRPAFIQHWTSLCVVDHKTQREADWTDIICCILY